MKLTDKLKEEHENIRLLLKIMGRACNELSTPQQVPPEHLEQMLELIREYADRCHHGKEEDLLFVAMVQVGIPKDGGPIAVMLSEHDRGRELVSKMSAAAAAYKDGKEAAALDFTQAAGSYIKLLDQHIQKENMVLFPMADAHISDEQQRALSKEHERVDREAFGEEKIAELLRTLGELEKTYSRSG
jgi:hemerythrin-like domain-containing protein